MQRCTVSSSDLIQIREAAYRLASRARSGGTGAAAAGWLRSETRPTSEPRRISSSIDLHAPPLELESWETFLAWGLELCRAHGGFVVDPQGFVVATRGNVPNDQFAGLGAEVAFGMEQLDRIEAESGSLLSVELQFKGRRILGIRIGASDGTAFIVGFVGSRPLADEVREAIVRQGIYSLPRLR